MPDTTMTLDSGEILKKVSCGSLEAEMICVRLVEEGGEIDPIAEFAKKKIFDVLRQNRLVGDRLSDVFNNACQGDLKNLIILTRCATLKLGHFADDRIDLHCFLSHELEKKPIDLDFKIMTSLVRERIPSFLMSVEELRR